MSKKFSLISIIEFLGIFLFISFVIPKNANAAFELPPDCSPSGWVYQCSGTTPDPALDCNLIGELTVSSWNGNDCLEKCVNDADGIVLGYGADIDSSDVIWYCCDGASYSDCQNNGTTIILGSGEKSAFIWWNPTTWFTDAANVAQGVVIGLPISLISFLSYILMSLLVLLSGVLGTIMMWITNATLSIPVIPNHGVDIVTVGWTFTRDLVNMFFILIAVFIGLATVLRVQSYEVKKTLPTLIIIVLLVNFSGVLVGVLVDFSNLVTNFFLTGIESNDFNQSFQVIGAKGQNLGDQLVGLVTNLGGSPANYISALITPLMSIWVIIIFYFVLILALLVIVLVFFMRTVYLWIIVILAPIAFASYILPATRSFWNSWWKNLTQWSIVGIPISFFLYLSSKIITTSGSANITGNFTNTASGAVPSDLSSLISSLLAPITAVAFLFYGIGVSLAGAPAGAKGVINWGTKTGVNAAKWTGRKIRESNPISKTEGFLRGKMENAAGVNRLPGFRPGSWEIEKKRRIDSQKKNFEGLPDTDAGNEAIAKRITQAGASKEQVIKGMEILAERRVTDKIDTKTFGKLLDKHSNDSNFNKKAIWEARPDLASHLNITKTEKGADGKEYKKKLTDSTEATRFVMSKMERDAISKIQKEAYEDPNVIRGIIDDERKFEQLTRTGKIEIKDKFKNTLKNNKAFDFSETNSDRIKTKEERDKVRDTLQIISTDARWNPTEEEIKKAGGGEKKAKTAQTKIVSGSQENFNEARKNYKGK
jgi:hypothetical protein